MVSKQLSTFQQQIGSGHVALHKLSQVQVRAELEGAKIGLRM
jgi:hypothetical protein